MPIHSPENSVYPRLHQRLSWLEGIRAVAAVWILIYHAQLLFTDYAYTPKPTGLQDNLNLIGEASDRLGQSLLLHIVAVPNWFGFQAVDVFILMAGFVLVLSTQGPPLHVGDFLKRRLQRILWPFWTVAWGAYPFLWALGIATISYRPDPWHVFAGASFPLLFDFEGGLLLDTSGPWWFIPLILSFTLISPLLSYLLRRWGPRNLLMVSLGITLTYRYLAVYRFEGHLTYTLIDTAHGWSPFVSFLSKLSTFVVGMVIAEAYSRRCGPLLWRPQRLVLLGLLMYGLGFVCQFYRMGWVVCDLLLPVGLMMGLSVAFRALSTVPFLAAGMRSLGAHSYTYFLIHGMVMDRTINLWVGDSILRYWIALPLMIVGTLVLAMIADAALPLLRRVVLRVLRDFDYLLARVPAPLETPAWVPRIGDRVWYQGSREWSILNVEPLMDEGTYYLCQISNGAKTTWLGIDNLKLDQPAPDRPIRVGARLQSSAPEL